MNIAKMMIPKACAICLQADDSVRQGLELLRIHGFTAMPVLDEEGHYLGCVTEGDFLQQLMKTGSTDLRDHERCRIRDIMRAEFCPPLNMFAKSYEVIEAVLKQNFVPIVDDRGCFCGIVTRWAVLSCIAEHEGVLARAKENLPLV